MGIVKKRKTSYFKLHTTRSLFQALRKAPSRQSYFVIRLFQSRNLMPHCHLQLIFGHNPQRATRRSTCRQRRRPGPIPERRPGQIHRRPRIVHLLQFRVRFLGAQVAQVLLPGFAAENGRRGFLSNLFLARGSGGRRGCG